ncbi:MAG: ATP-binding protein [Pseudomonadota bacterium]
MAYFRKHQSEAKETPQPANRSELESLLAGNEAILDNLPDPLIMVDRARRMVRLNRAAQQQFGGDLTGRDLSTALRHPALLEGVDDVLEDAQGRIVDFSLPGTLDRYYNARIAGLPQDAPDGTAVILSLHDMTGVRRAERLRADFVANASHELRTPLSSLVGFVETLSGPAKDDEEARERFLSIMHEQASRMSRLIEDLLSLSRIEMAEHAAPTGAVDLAQVLDSVVGALELYAQEKSMTIDVSHEDLPPIIGDKDELAQVLQNLVDNAIKYGRAETPVTVSAELSAEATRRLQCPGVAVSVSDMGDGVAPAQIPRLTERFYRVDTARSRQLGGTGLGLAIVKHIVNRHRGALEIESEVGKGSTFTVFLPAAQRR